MHEQQPQDYYVTHLYVTARSVARTQNAPRVYIG